MNQSLKRITYLEIQYVQYPDSSKNSKAQFTFKLESFKLKLDLVYSRQQNSCQTWCIRKVAHHQTFIGFFGENFKTFPESSMRHCTFSSPFLMLIDPLIYHYLFFFSSSRFTDSKRYEAYFEKCFSLEEQRSGEICNACVLLVKRYIKLPAGSTRHWNHVVDARSGPGIKSLVKSKKQKENNTSNRDENDTPEKINKKHFYRSKKKPAVVRKRNPSIPVSGFLDMSRWQK